MTLILSAESIEFIYQRALAIVPTTTRLILAPEKLTLNYYYIKMSNVYLNEYIGIVISKRLILALN